MPYKLVTYAAKGHRLRTDMFNEAEYCKHKQQKYFVYLTFIHTQVKACYVWLAKLVFKRDLEG